MISSQVSIGVAFIAGLASFLSPCVLPLVPIYLAQLVGHSVTQSTGDTENQVDRPARLDTFLHALIFVAGCFPACFFFGAASRGPAVRLRHYQIALVHVMGE